MGRLHTVSEAFRSLKAWVVTAWAAVTFVAEAAVNWLSQFYLRVDLWIVEGQEQASHLPLAILCAASEQDRNYLLRLIFGSNYRERHLGRYWLWNLDRAISAADRKCSLLVVQMFESHLRFTHFNDWFLIPTWVCGGVDLPRDAAAAHKVVGDLRRVRNHGLQYEITRDRRKFDDFYYNMFMPYIGQTFGDCAHLTSYGGLRLRLLNSELLLVKSEGVSIAGQLIHYDKEAPILWNIGIRDGNRDHVKNGAQCALYQFGLQHLQEQGFTWASLGWSRPFLHDGVLKFKRKWSQRINQSDPSLYGLKVLLQTNAARAFLCNNPFIFKRQELHYAAVFVDSGKTLTTEHVAQIESDYFHQGLSGLEIYNLGSEGAPSPDSAPANLPEHVQLGVAS